MMTSQADYIAATLTHMRQLIDRCCAISEHIAHDRLDAELNTVALQLQITQKVALEVVAQVDALGGRIALTPEALQAMAKIGAADESART